MKEQRKWAQEQKRGHGHKTVGGKSTQNMFSSGTLFVSVSRLFCCWLVRFPRYFVLGFSNQHAAIRCSTLDACMPTSTDVMIHIKLQTNASFSLIVDTKEG